MVSTTSLNKDSIQLIKTWYENDKLGRKYIGLYSDPEKCLQLLNPDSRWIFIVYQGNEAIGFFDLEGIGKRTGGFSFYLSPQYRGKGNSKIILQELVYFAKTQGLYTLKGGVETDNTSSINSLLKFGFEKTGVDKDGLFEYQLKL